jgi:hypothetical protein
LLFGSLVGDGAQPLQTDVAVRIHQARQHPNAGGDGLRVTDRFQADHTVDYPKITMLAFGQYDADEVQAIVPSDRLRAHHFLLAEAVT